MTTTACEFDELKSKLVMAMKFSWCDIEAKHCQWPQWPGCLPQGWQMCLHTTTLGFSFTPPMIGIVDSKMTTSSKKYYGRTHDKTASRKETGSVRRSAPRHVPRESLFPEDQGVRKPPSNRGGPKPSGGDAFWEPKRYLLVPRLSVRATCRNRKREMFGPK